MRKKFKKISKSRTTKSTFLEHNKMARFWGFLKKPRVNHFELKFTRRGVRCGFCLKRTLTLILNFFVHCPNKGMYTKWHTAMAHHSIITLYFIIILLILLILRRLLAWLLHYCCTLATLTSPTSHYYHPPVATIMQTSSRRVALKRKPIAQIREKKKHPLTSLILQCCNSYAFKRMGEKRSSTSAKE